MATITKATQSGLRAAVHTYKRASSLGGYTAYPKVAVQADNNDNNGVIIIMTEEKKQPEADPTAVDPDETPEERQEREQSENLAERDPSLGEAAHVGSVSVGQGTAFWTACRFWRR